MQQSLLTDIIGYGAACLTTFAMLPQAMQVFRTGEVAQLSLRAFTMATVGAVIWLIYGFLISNAVIVSANAIGGFIVGYIFIKKLKWQLGRRSK